MKTRRIIEGCPELEYYNYKIYVGPESWCESLWIQSRGYQKVENEDVIEEKLGQGLEYGLYLKEKNEWEGLPKSVKTGGSKIKRINQCFKINYNGGPIPPFARVLSSDGDDISHESLDFILNLLVLKTTKPSTLHLEKTSFRCEQYRNR